MKLIEDEPEIDPDLIQKYSGIARRKAERLESLINEFFEITRFSTHKLSLEPVKTNLSRMLMQITYEFNPILTAAPASDAFLYISLLFHSGPMLPGLILTFGIL